MTEQQVGRLAFREVGEWWVCYFAVPDTMAGAIELGRIKLTIVRQNMAHKEAYMRLMRTVMGMVIEEVTGVAPSSWKTQPAPESERD